MSEKIEEKIGIPVVTVTYDGTGGSMNDILIPYLKYMKTSNRKNTIKTKN